MQYLMSEEEYQEYMELKRTAHKLPELKAAVAWAHSVLKPKNCGNECSCDVCPMSWLGFHYDKEGIKDYTDFVEGKHGVPTSGVSSTMCTLYRNYSQ